MMNVGINPFIGQQVGYYQYLSSHHFVSAFILNTLMRKWLLNQAVWVEDLTKCHICCVLRKSM